MKWPTAKEMEASLNELIELPDGVPSEMVQRINNLRQWLNEDRKCTPMVTNADILYWLVLMEKE